jgi:uncharacterized membrane protein YdbT with pleckstrin-like domain
MLADDEHVFLHARRHGIVLARPLVWAIAFAVAGAIALRHGWPLPVLGAVLLGCAALVGVRAVWRWDTTHVVVTTEKLFVVHGTLRRRSAAVPLTTVKALELEQSLLGRIFGYGTVVAGPLEVTYVPDPRGLCRLVQRLVP